MLEPGALIVPDVSSSDLRASVRDGWVGDFVVWVFIGIVGDTAHFLNFPNNYAGEVAIDSRFVKHTQGTVIVCE